MELTSLNQSPGDSYAGDGSHEGSTQRLRRTLQSVFENAALHRADGPESQNAAVRASLRQVCADARHSGLRAEQLLVIIKEVWAGLPSGMARVPSVHGDERLNYVISTCVDEYYGHSPTDPEALP